MNVRLWWGIAWRFLWRARRSTGALAAMIVSAVGTLVFLDALAVGVNDAMIRNSVSLVAGHITLDNLPPDITPETLYMAGVERVLLRRTTSAWINHNAETVPTTLIEMDPDAERLATALWRKTTSGRYPQRKAAELFLGEPVATRLHLQVGDTVTVAAAPGHPGRTVVLCGTFATGIAAVDHSLSFCPVRHEDAPGPLSAAVFLTDGADPEVIRSSLRLPPDATATTWAERMPDLRQLIDLNALCMLLVMVMVFFIVSLGIACAFVIFILKNIREHGILKSMGVYTAETVVLLIFEITILTLTAAGAGLLLGCLGTWCAAGPGIDLGALTSHNQYFVVSGIVHPRLTLVGVILPPALALTFALLAGIWPMWLVARHRPADILRSAA